MHVRCTTNQKEHNLKELRLMLFSMEKNAHLPLPLSVLSNRFGIIIIIYIFTNKVHFANMFYIFTNKVHFANMFSAVTFLINVFTALKGPQF